MNSDFKDLLTDLNDFQVKYLVVDGWVEGMSLEHFSMERTMFQIGLPPARVDFLTSIPGLSFGSAYADRETVIIGDMTVPFISLPDLMIAKKVAGRPQDLIDLDALQRVATTKFAGD